MHLGTWVGVLGIWLYRRLLRPVLRRRCLFTESCSAYGLRMVRAHGLWRGGRQTWARLQTCRMPASARFVLGEDGQPRLLDAGGFGGVTVPAGALALLAEQARAAHAANAAHGAGTASPAAADS